MNYWLIYELVELFKQDHTTVHLDDFLAVDAVFHDAHSGARPSDENTLFHIWDS